MRAAYWGMRPSFRRAGHAPVSPPERTGSPEKDTRTNAKRSPARELSARPRQMEAVGDRGGLGPTPHVELGEDPRDVDARRLLGHVQRRTDLPVRRALRKQREHLPLTLGEA